MSDEPEENASQEQKKSPCPMYPSSVTKIMDVIDRMDKGKTDDLGAMQEISGILKESKKAKLAAITNLEKKETEQTESP